MFDTSWWTPADVLALCALVPPGQILFASDAPYGTPTIGAIITARCARQVGIEGDAFRTLMGAQADRLIAHDDLIDAGPAIGTGRIDADPLFDRIATFIVSALSREFAGETGAEPLALARQGCEAPAASRTAPVFAAAARLIDRFAEVSTGESDGTVYTPGLHLLMCALHAVRTPDVPVPAA